MADRSMHYAFEYADGLGTTTGEGWTSHVAGVLYAFTDQGTRDDWAAESPTRSVLWRDGLPQGWVASEALCEHGDEPGSCEVEGCWASSADNPTIADGEDRPRILYAASVDMIQDGTDEDLTRLLAAVQGALEQRWPEATIMTEAIDGGEFRIEPVTLLDEFESIVDAVWDDEATWRAERVMVRLGDVVAVLRKRAELISDEVKAEALTDAADALLVAFGPEAKSCHTSGSTLAAAKRTASSRPWAASSAWTT